MVKVKKISINEVRPLVELSYKDDDDLFEHYHLAKMPFEDCVNMQMVQIKQAAAEYKLNYYKVIYDHKPIGYIVCFNDVLYSFAINIRYRKKEILIGFWKSIKTILTGKFGCAIYKNNTRAIAWLERNGMVISEEDSKHNSVTLINFN